MHYERNESETLVMAAVAAAVRRYIFKYNTTTVRIRKSEKIDIDVKRNERKAECCRSEKAPLRVRLCEASKFFMKT